MKGKKYIPLIIALLAFVAVFQLSLVPALAAGGASTRMTGGLTDLFRMEGFKGSWSVIDKNRWVGTAMNWIISFISLLGLALLIYQRLITLLYLSNRPLFDRVDEIKSSSMGSREGGGLFGLRDFYRSLYDGRSGFSGFDVVIGFAYSLIPNIKAYSDYSRNRPQRQQFTDDDDAPKYMLKVLVPTVMMVFFFSIGFSGTLVKAYAMLSDAMSAAADYAVDQDLALQVNKLLRNGPGYQFTLGANGTAIGALQESIARDIYAKTLTNYDEIDANLKLMLGKNVEQYVHNVLFSTNPSAYPTSATATMGDDNFGDIGTAIPLSGNDKAGVYDHLKALLDNPPPADGNTDLYNIYNEDDVRALEWSVTPDSNPDQYGKMPVIPMINLVPKKDSNGNDVVNQPNASRIDVLYIHVTLTKPINTGARNIWAPGSNAPLNATPTPTGP